jgi:hypothetical protein
VLKNTSHTLAGTALLVALSAASVVPAIAEPINAPDSNQILISQLRGHDVYRGDEQMEYPKYVIGTVVGMTGDIIAVKFPEPVKVNDEDITHINVGGVSVDMGGTGPIFGGKDVIFMIEKDDNGHEHLTYVGAAHPAWILKLIENGYKISADQHQMNLATIDWGQTQAVALPPMQAESVPAPQPEVSTEPIRGMW